VKHKLRRIVGGYRAAILIMALVAGAASASGAAQDFPQNPIKIIVPFTAGGSIDVLARMLAPKLQSNLGKPIVVEDRPGASTRLGTLDVMHAAPDGYTVLFASDSHVINAVVNTPPPYDPIRDFTPLSLLIRFPNVMFAHASLPVTTLPQAVALIRARPGKFNYGTMGPGTTGYVAFEYLKRRAGLDVGFVPYLGAAPVMRALAGNEVQFAILNYGIGRAVLASGDVKALAVTGPDRLPQLPDVPTVAEQGFPDLDVFSWFAAFAPAATPPPVAARLSSALAAAIADPKIRVAFAAQGWESVGSSPQELASWVREERDRWEKFVRVSGVALQ
jgi:tripartite-type tricarboxylate transporter receptor subunit TctC